MTEQYFDATEETLRNGAVSVRNRFSLAAAILSLTISLSFLSGFWCAEQSENVQAFHPGPEAYGRFGHVQTCKTLHFH